MADDITITIAGEDKASAAIQSVRNQFAGLKTEADKFASTQNDLNARNERMVASLKGIVTAVTAMIGVLAAGVAAFKKIIDETTRYASEVRNLSLISGESAEVTSRLIQVAEDYKVTTQDLMTAQRQLAREGYSLNIDTIAKLSDEYLKLNTGAERQQFLTENLGRSSAAWAEIMSQGSSAIMERADSINEMLILDQKALDSARAYEFALDDLNDQLMGLKISVGEYAIPALTSLMNFAQYSWGSAGWGQLVTFFQNLQGPTTGVKPSWSRSSTSGIGGIMVDYINRWRGGSVNLGNISEQQWNPTASSGLPGAGPVAPDAEDYSQKMGAIIDYAEKYQSVVDKITQKEIELAKARSQGYSETGTKLTGLKDELAALEQQQTNLANTFILSMLQIKLAQDGISDSDIQIYLKMAVNMGIMSQAAADAALQMWNLGNAQVYAATNPYVPPVIGGQRSGAIEMGNRAGGGSFEGWAMVGDAPGGGVTPYTEWVYAPHGAVVYNQAQMSGQSASPMAGGGTIPPMGGNKYYYGPITLVVEQTEADELRNLSQ